MGIVIALLDIVQMLLWVLSIVIIVQAVFSWLVVFNVVNTSSDFVRAIWTALDRITAPLYRPIRRIMPATGAMDFSPLVLIIGLTILEIVVTNLAIASQ